MSLVTVAMPVSMIVAAAANMARCVSVPVFVIVGM